MKPSPKPLDSTTFAAEATKVIHQAAVEAGVDPNDCDLRMDDIEFSQMNVVEMIKGMLAALKIAAHQRLVQGLVTNRSLPAAERYLARWQGERLELLHDWLSWKFAREQAEPKHGPDDQL